MKDKKLAPLVASRTEKDIMTAWGVDVSLWEKYASNPDLNSGTLDFKKPDGASRVSSHLSDLLSSVTKYSIMALDESSDEESVGVRHGNSRNSNRQKAASRLPIVADATTIITGTITTETGTTTATTSTRRSKETPSSEMTTNDKKEAQKLGAKSAAIPILPLLSAATIKRLERNRNQTAGGTFIKAKAKNSSTKSDKTKPYEEAPGTHTADLNRDHKKDEDDDRADLDDDGNIEELRKTKKVKVRQKDKIWGYDWLGRPVPCPFEARLELPHQMYWENKNHFGDPIVMNLPSEYDLPEEDMDPGLMKVKNIVKDLFDKKQKRFKDEAMAELNEIRGRILDIYNRYGIQWSFPDETEEERIKRENRVQNKLNRKAQAEKKASQEEVGKEDESETEEETGAKREEPEAVFVGGMPLRDASKLTGIPPEKLLLMSEGMQDLMIWLQRKALEEEDRLQLTKEIEDSNERAVQRTQVLLEANRWLQGLGIDLTNPNIDCPYNDVAQNEMHARHHAHSGVNHNIFARVSKLVVKTVVMGIYILQEYFDWQPAPPASPSPEATEDDVNASRLVAEDNRRSLSVIQREEDGDKKMAMGLTQEVQDLCAPKGFFTDEELIVNADNWRVAVNSLEKQFKSAMELTYSKVGRDKVEQCRKQAFCIKRTFEQQLSVITMRGAELEELQSTLQTLQLELYDVKQYHRLRENVIKEKAADSDLWGFRVKELEHTVAGFLRTIQMFDMEYRAAVPKIGKKIGEAMKYTSHITNADEAKVKDKSEMTAFGAIANSVKELDSKMTQTLKDFQEEQRQRQVMLRGRIDAASKRKSEGFPPPPPPTTDYSVIVPKPSEPKARGRSPKGGKGKKSKNKNAARKHRNINYSDETESDHEESFSWLGDAARRRSPDPNVGLLTTPALASRPSVGSTSSSRKWNIGPGKRTGVSRRSESLLPPTGGPLPSIDKTTFPPIDKKYLRYL